ncbi:MAG: cyclic 2,3-diphosphoglycerate synthase [Actinobacteria bacterium]|nr:cyclic 2,3-diphosphoglycerate synthase [Actinomycetota bacterium]
MGAAGRDFHNFNMVFRNDPAVQVVAFTATQIPGIERRRYPAELAGPNYPEGIPIEPEDRLTSLIVEEHVGEVVFAYSDVSHDFVMHQASRVLAAGADFCLLGPDQTMIEASVPVIAVLAVRTGAGKSPASRLLADLLILEGLKPAIIRHPMPYGDLAAQRVQRFASIEDLDTLNTTIEEREEYEPHLRRGLVVWAGVDYPEIVAQAEKETSIILWDGGNNDFSFLRADLEIVVVDPFRPGHELLYHPGEVNLRRAQVVVVNKVNTAPADNIEQVIANIRRVNPDAVVVKADSVITIAGSEEIRGKRVLVIEDGPTLTHGGMATGAGVEAARQRGAQEIVDPRPFAKGTLAETYNRYPHLGPILPALGYYPEQLRDLEATVAAVPADLVISATPFSLDKLIHVAKPVVRVSYEMVETGEPHLPDFVRAFLRGRGLIR